jgi:hypothetical protein
MSLVVADANIRDRHGITFPHSRVARLRSPGDGSHDACPRPFPDKGSFKLGKRTKHLGHKHALRARRVDRVVDRTEVCALSSQGLDDLQQMRQRTSQAVNPYDQQGIALPVRVHVLSLDVPCWHRSPCPRRSPRNLARARHPAGRPYPAHPWKRGRSRSMLFVTFHLMVPSDRLTPYDIISREQMPASRSGTQLAAGLAGLGRAHQRERPCGQD